jgi:hypothetical protein
MTRTDPVTGRADDLQDPDASTSRARRSPSTTTAWSRRGPASYVSIFYPASLGMMGDGDTTGKSS